MQLNLFARKRKKPQLPDGPGDSAAHGGWPAPPQPRALMQFSPEAEQLRLLLENERYGIFLQNPAELVKHAEFARVRDLAAAAVDEKFALVPDGFVSLVQTVQDLPGSPEVDIETQPFLLALGTVTNAEFQRFVYGGGYQEMELWPEEIWPHLMEFVDQTGRSGPRYWREGQFEASLAEHPVVGVSYFEAAAYAAWAGYRLPNEAEWQMAASWRIRSSAQVMRRYPWGDALDTDRCNLWASGVRHTVPVWEYPDGAAPNGVRQLIGNVWEWTTSDCLLEHEEGGPVVGDMVLKSIRGGAFDTYFAAQATSTFRTGLAGIARVHNVGFRCATDYKEAAS